MATKQGNGSYIGYGCDGKWAPWIWKRAATNTGTVEPAGSQVGNTWYYADSNETEMQTIG